MPRDDGAVSTLALLEEVDAGELRERVYSLEPETPPVSRTRTCYSIRTMALIAIPRGFHVSAVARGRPRTARAVVTSRARVLELDPRLLEEICCDRPEVSVRLLRVMAERLIDAEQRLSKLGVDDLMRPIVRALTQGG